MQLIKKGYTVAVKIMKNIFKNKVKFASILVAISLMLVSFMATSKHELHREFAEGNMKILNLKNINSYMFSEGSEVKEKESLKNKERPKK